jgi:hypothetical protein
VIPLPRFLLFWSAAPAIAFSIWLLCITNTPRSAQVLQVAAAAMASAIFAVLIRTRRTRMSGAIHWAPFVLALSLFIPLLEGGHGNPERWLAFGSVRLYVASVVLPIFLYLLGASTARAPGLWSVSVASAAIALVLQPDASQMSAMALAMLVLLIAPGAHLALRLALLVFLLLCAVAAWRVPDPLAPVRHVEGVFSLAAGVSPFALVAALVFAALPVAALLWSAWLTRSIGTFAVAVYYAALFAQAPLQVTPVPLLGFGAGPILGYFLVTGMITRARHVPDPSAEGASSRKPRLPSTAPSAKR